MSDSFFMPSEIFDDPELKTVPKRGNLTFVSLFTVIITACFIQNQFANPKDSFSKTALKLRFLTYNSEVNEVMFEKSFNWLVEHGYCILVSGEDYTLKPEYRHN